MGADKGAIPPNLAPNKFRERLSRPSRMQENLFAAGALPGPRCGSLQRSSRPTSWFKGTLILMGGEARREEGVRGKEKRGEGRFCLPSQPQGITAP